MLFMLPNCQLHGRKKEVSYRVFQQLLPWSRDKITDTCYSVETSVGLDDILKRYNLYNSISMYPFVCVIFTDEGLLLLLSLFNVG